MLSILAPLLVFGLVVFVHELGHFVAAKLVGVYAPRFSIGFGPALFKRRVGETEYVLAALPLGRLRAHGVPRGRGHGAHRGRRGTPARHRAHHRRECGWPRRGRPRRRPAPRQGLGPGGDGAVRPQAVPEHRWFESKSLVARLFILLAGVTMNVLLAYVINAGSVVARGRPYIPAVIDSAVAGRPAALAGLTRGDSVVAVNGEAVRTWSQVVERVAPVTNGTVTLRVVRAGTPRDVTLSPKPEQAQDPVTGTPKTVGRIGVLPRAVEARERLSLGGALAEGARETAFAATSVVRVLRGSSAATSPCRTRAARSRSRVRRCRPHGSGSNRCCG
jgi:regulator of sigma E protease